METVQLTCGHCNKLMAIAVQDLGTKVHCPHCQQVVQAPAANPSRPDPVPPPDPVFAAAPTQEVESIFSPEESADDLFGGPPRPRLELPPEPAPVPAPPLPARPPPEATVAFSAGDGVPVPTEATVAEAPDETPAAILALKRPRPSPWGALAVILLVPYAVIMTGAFLYMLYVYHTYRAADPLERMLDPNPKEGGARRISPDQPLPNKLKTSLNQPLQVGDLEVKPLQVKLGPGGDLVLRLRMRNLSKDTVFNPFPIAFARRWPGRKPYTYLQAGSHVIEGGDAEWFRKRAGREEQLSDGDLPPGQEMTATLSTSSDKDTRAAVQRILKAGVPLLWRLHVRRGLIEVRGQAVSGTAVIGVTFTARDVKRPREASARPDGGPDHGQGRFFSAPLFGRAVVGLPRPRDSL